MVGQPMWLLASPPRVGHWAYMILIWAALDVCCYVVVVVVVVAVCRGEAVVQSSSPAANIGGSATHGTFLI